MYDRRKLAALAILGGKFDVAISVFLQLQKIIYIFRIPQKNGFHYRNLFYKLNLIL